MNSRFGKGLKAKTFLFYSFEILADKARHGNGDFQSLTLPGAGTIAVTAYRWRAPVEWLFPGGTRLATQVDGLLRSHHTTLYDPGSNPAAQRLYTWNAENHITGIASEEGSHLYTLDELYRLTAAAYAWNTALRE